MTTKPIIGIAKPDKEDFIIFEIFKLAIKTAGGIPLILKASNSEHKSVNIDGLLLGGGRDIFPGLYKQSAKEEYVYDRARDEMEIFWAERARDENIPTLGICRGAQLMNVICGGTLHMSVSEAYENANYPDGIIHNTFYRKDIQIHEGTLLNTITNKTALRVNSIHKQAIAQTGAHIVINAQEKNGVIQAIAHTKHPFFLGIQFHPEFMLHKRVFRDIFRALINAASERTCSTS